MVRRLTCTSMVVRRFGLAVVAAGSLLIVVACSSNTAPKGPTATVGTLPPTTTSTTTIEDVEAQVTAAYLEAEAAYYEVAKAPDPDDERIVQHYTGDALELVRTRLTRFQAEGIVSEFTGEGPPRHSILSTEFVDDDATSVLTVCVVNDVRQVSVAGGEVLDDDVVTVIQEIKLVLKGGSWLVSGGQLIEEVEEC